MQRPNITRSTSRGRCKIIIWLSAEKWAPSSPPSAVSNTPLSPISHSHELAQDSNPPLRNSKGQGVGVCDADPHLHCLYLVLAPGALLPGRSWKFSLDLAQGLETVSTFTYPLTTECCPKSHFRHLKNAQARSAITIDVNAAPTAGRLAVTPEQDGKALHTPFYLLTTSWTDNPADLPLYFSFSQLISDDSFVELLRLFKTTADHTTTLPASHPSPFILE